MTKTLFFLSVLFISIQSMAQSYSRKYNDSENKIVWPESFNPKVSDFYVHNEIEINASPEIVWQKLVSASNWKDWYEGIKNIKFKDPGQENLAKDVRVFWNSMGQALNNTVVEFVPYERIAWQFNEKKIQGHHAWLIIPTEYGCKVITDESQTGRLAKLQKMFIPRKLMKQHDKWLKLLKVEAEKASKSIGATLSRSERDHMMQVLQKSHDKFMLSIEGLTQEQMHYKSNPKKWSIAECVEHITLAELHFPEIVKEQMLNTPNPKMRKKIKIEDESIRGKMLSRKWKAKSPEIFKPSKIPGSLDNTIESYVSQRQWTIEYIKTTRDDLRNHFWKHPLTGYIDLYQTLLLMSAHLERHTDQIEGLKKYLHQD